LSSHGLRATRGFLAARDLLQALRDDHEAAAARFSWPRFEHFNWALDWFDRICVDNTRAAVRVNTTTVTYAELSESSNRVANWLRRLGLRRGQRILLLLDDQLAFCEVMLAAMKLGAVLVLARASLAATDVVDRVGPAFIIAALHLADGLVGVDSPATRICVGGRLPGWRTYSDAYLERRSFSPEGLTRVDDPFLITPASFGGGRMVCHTHAMPIGTLPGTYWSGLLPGDVHAAVASPGSAEHVWSSFFEPFNAEASVVAVPGSGDGALVDTLAEERVSSLCAPPTVWASLSRQDVQLPPSLRETRSLGCLGRDLVEGARTVWGVNLRAGYGQAETGVLIGTTAGAPAEPGAIGRPLPGCPVVLRDPHADEPSHEGEICVDLTPRPAGIMSGYLDDADATAASRRGGFHRTGDFARRDAAGCLTRQISPSRTA
jgi:acetyl-CoA synthetase